MDAHAAAKDSASDDSSLFRKLQPNRTPPVDKEALKANQDKSGASPQDSDQEMEEISIAGRTKMQVPKPKSSVAPVEQKEEPKKEKTEPEDDPEIRDELNGILKMSPSTLNSLPLLFCFFFMPRADVCCFFSSSYHLL